MPTENKETMLENDTLTEQVGETLHAGQVVLHLLDVARWEVLAQVRSQCHVVRRIKK